MTSTVPTLAEFVLARIREDKAKALAASPAPWCWEDGELTAHDPNGYYRSAADRMSIVSGTVYVDVVGSGELDMEPADAVHIAHWDPARVLAECETKRRIVERFALLTATWGERELAPYELGYLHAVEQDEEDMLRLLGLPYVDHPDYREEWRP